MLESELTDARALRRFRLALAAVDAAPSAASVAALREAASPLMNQLRAAYTATGSPYGDDRAAVFRWLSDICARRDRGTMASSGA